jgi:hypothetical protein
MRPARSGKLSRKLINALIKQPLAVCHPESFAGDQQILPRVENENLCGRRRGCDVHIRSATGVALFIELLKGSRASGRAI